MNWKTTYILFSLFLFSYALFAQDEKNSYTISGYIEDAQTGEKLIGVNILDLRSEQGTVTNTYGFFSLSLPADSVLLRVSYVGFAPNNYELKLDKDISLNIALSSSTTLDVVEVTGEAIEQIEEQSQMSRITVPIKQIQKLPAFLGETDVLKALQLLPGVQSGGEGQSGLFVRGGSPDQNLMLLDGVPVYNASHLFGFFSVFNSDAIKDVNLIKGGFPARFGGRLSSVLEINMKEGNNKEWHGRGSISTVASKITVEGPLVKDRTSMLISARRTYIDILAKPFIRSSFSEGGGSGDAGYFFHDVNFKINHKFSDRDKLYLSTYIGRDKFYFNEKDNFNDESYETGGGLGWGNVTTALRWNHLWNQKLFSNLTLTLSNYDFNTKVEEEDIANNERSYFLLEYESGIQDWGGKMDFDYVPNPNHFIRFGVNYTYHTFKPGAFDTRIESEDIDDNYQLLFGNSNIHAHDIATYVEDDFKVNDQLKLNVGLHFSAFQVRNEWYTSLQPRISTRYLLPGQWALKGSFASMRQYIQLLSNEGIGLPTDLWVPTTKRIKPQDAWQAAIGTAKTFGDSYEFSVEAYYKKMENVLSYKEGASLFQFSNWEEEVTQGQGESYGLEVFLQKKKGRFAGWIGYTLSWSNRQFDDLNFGKTYPYKYDRRHDISVVGTFEWTEKIHLSGTWVYGTGNAVTLGEANYVAVIPFAESQGSSGQIVEHYQDRNNFRMRAYHRFDFNIDFIKKKRTWTRTWSLGAYNVYSRKNPFYLYVAQEYDPDVGASVKKLKQVSLFPIIPSIAYKFEF